MTYCSHSPSTVTGNRWDRLEWTHRQAVPSTILAPDYSSRVKQHLALGEEKLRRRIGAPSFGAPSTTFLEVLDELDGVAVIATIPEKPPRGTRGREQACQRGENLDRTDLRLRMGSVS